jgi:4-hydroxybutyrate dehydrogenase
MGLNGGSLMKQFLIKPVIQCFSSFTEFAEQMTFAPEDCIFTVRHLHEKWFNPLKVPSSILLFENYGNGEPTDEMIDRIQVDFRKLNCRRVIAVGGGSVLDIAKFLALKPTTSAALDLFEGKAQLIKEKELILVPTTCGTGSEMTCISIAGIPSKGTKKGLAAEPLFADKAALIPELLYGLPRQVMITSSLDAMAHAMESFVAPRAHAYSELFSMESIRLLLKSYKTLLSIDDDSVVEEIAEDLMKASNYAGIAFGNVGVGAVHALAYPLGEKYHVFHGEACARFFSAVFQVYRSKKPQGKTQSLTQLLAQVLDCPEGQDSWEAMDNLLNQLLPPKSLREYGMTEDDIETFADSVVREQQRLLVNNYVELSRDEIRDIFKKLW